MQSQAVSPDELRQAKALLLREIPLSESSTDAIAGGLLQRAIHDLPLDEPTRAARKYVQLSADRVMTAYAKWLRPDDLVEVSQGRDSYEPGVQLSRRDAKTQRGSCRGFSQRLSASARVHHKHVKENSLHTETVMPG